jgi:hypothetical protein
VVVVVPVIAVHRLSLEAAQQVDALLAVVAEDHRAPEQVAHLVLEVLEATAFYWSTKSLEYEQSVRHPWWHRPQHHRA